MVLYCIALKQKILKLIVIGNLGEPLWVLGFRVSHKTQLGFQPAVVISSFSRVSSTFRFSEWVLIGFSI